MFTLIYLVLTPFILPYLRANFFIIMQISIAISGAGCLGIHAAS